MKTKIFQTSVEDATIRNDLLFTRTLNFKKI